MQLQDTDAYRKELATKLSRARKNLVILSAYVTVPGIQWLVNILKTTNIPCDIIVRWSLEDLTSSASSLEAYNITKKFGWNLYIAPELHAKAVLVDDKDLHLGSANLTGAGLGLVSCHNLELGVALDATLRDVQAIYAIRDESVLVTDELYNEIKSHLEKETKEIKSRKDWPESVKSHFHKAPERLWVADLFWTRPQEEPSAFRKDKAINISHDSEMLNLNNGLKNTPKEDICRAVFSCRIWKWVYKLIQMNGEQGLFFGAITSSLHDALLDDPTPYRKDVKELVQNIYAWLRFINLPNIIIDQPGKRSERIRKVLTNDTTLISTRKR